jgi:putative membrane protein
MPVDTSRADSANEQRTRPILLSDHLANERTYLAHLRTSVSLMSFGIAVNRFSVFLEQSDLAPGTPHPASRLVSSERFGIDMVALGMALLAWAAVHYYLVLRQIERQDFRPRPSSILTLTGLVLICGLGGVVWLFVG